jgi:hypothetical protein
VANDREESLFDRTKIEWLLAEGLDDMDAGGRQMMLVMAETRLAGGYRPTAQEKQVVAKLRALAGEEYDARDIRRKVRAMVRNPTREDSPSISLPPAFNRLLRRLRTSEQDQQDQAE